MTDDRTFYGVVRSLYDITVPDHLEFGYEYERDFRHALWQLVDRWKGRVGECVRERNGFLLLRFHDTPGGRPDEAWMPRCLLVPADKPDYLDVPPVDEVEAELDRAFEFD